MLRIFTAAILAAVSISCAAPGGSGPGPIPAGVTEETAAGLFVAQKFSEAGRQYEALAGNPAPGRKAFLLAQLGKCRAGLADWLGAIAKYDEALDQVPTPEVKVEILYRRGIANNGRGRHDLAVMDLQQVQGAPKEVRDAAVKSEEFQYLTGVTMLRAGLWPQGRRVLDQLVREFPEAPESEQARLRMSLTKFRIQIGSFADEVAAKRVATEATGKGLKAECPAHAPKVVLVGGYATITDAAKDLDRVRAAGYSTAFVIP